MGEQFECEVGVEQAGERIVKIRGEVDLATAPELEAGLLGIFDDGAQSVVLDLSDLAFIDSSGLRVLVALSKDARSRGALVALRNVPRSTQRVLELTGLADWFAEPTGG